MALRGVNLEIGRGDIFGIIGMSGAGKSTLLHVLNGTHSASGGEILSYPEVGMPHDVSKLKRPLTQRLAQSVRDDLSGLLPGTAPRRAHQRPAWSPQPDFNPEVAV